MNNSDPISYLDWDSSNGDENVKQILGTTHSIFAAESILMFVNAHYLNTH